ncbi:hypothetical protein ACLOJK_011001 [Asimina triloba]
MDTDIRTICGVQATFDYFSIISSGPGGQLREAATPVIVARLLSPPRPQSSLSAFCPLPVSASHLPSSSFLLRLQPSPPTFESISPCICVYLRLCLRLPLPELRICVHLPLHLCPSPSSSPPHRAATSPSPSASSQTAKPSSSSLPRSELPHRLPNPVIFFVQIAIGFPTPVVFPA